MLQSFPTVLADIDEKAAVLIVSMMVFGFLMYVIHSIRKTRETREVEQTKREIAAYIAEGSIAPDDGVKLMEAGKQDKAQCVSAIADGVAWGMISPGKAERLIRAMRDDRAQANDPTRAPAAS